MVDGINGLNHGDRYRKSEVDKRQKQDARKIIIDFKTAQDVQGSDQLTRGERKDLLKQLREETGCSRKEAKEVFNEFYSQDVMSRKDAKAWVKSYMEENNVSKKDAYKAFKEEHGYEVPQSKFMKALSRGLASFGGIFLDSNFDQPADAKIYRALSDDSDASGNYTHVPLDGVDIIDTTPVTPENAAKAKEQLDIITSAMDNVPESDGDIGAKFKEVKALLENGKSNEALNLAARYAQELGVENSYSTDFSKIAGILNGTYVENVPKEGVDIIDTTPQAVM